MMMVMNDGPPKERGRHRVKVENEIIKRRERDFRHQQMWNGTVDYYKRWDKVTNKFDQWTSPQYYQDNNRLLSEIKHQKTKEIQLEERQQKLKQLLEDEQKAYEIELTVKKNLKPLLTESKSNEIPTTILKDINDGLKAKEDEKRRREAELKLYHSWRQNNPIVRQFESKYKWKDLKLSWLDQQIEKKMQKEQEEKERKIFLKQQEEKIRKMTKRQDDERREIEEKRTKLKEQLDKQIEDLKQREQLSLELKEKETADRRHEMILAEMEDRIKQEERRIATKECALYNIKQHKMKLKQKTKNIQEDLEKEQELIITLKALELQDLLDDENKKKEIKNGLDEFLAIVQEQKELEKRRQKHLEFVFDSEAKTVYDRQWQMWNSEDRARKAFLKDVLSTVKKQIQDNCEKNRQRQIDILKEREEMLAKIEEYNKEMCQLQNDEKQKKVQLKEIFDEEVKLKNARKQVEETTKLDEINKELERVRLEEEQLNREILAIQRGQGPIRPQRRTRLLY